MKVRLIVAELKESGLMRGCVSVGRPARRWCQRLDHPSQDSDLPVAWPAQAQEVLPKVVIKSIRDHTSNHTSS